MKAISIRQPWASLIMAGGKDIENRTWPTRMRGRVYVHATATDIDLEFEAACNLVEERCITGPARDMLLGRLYSRSHWPTGQILGSVEITGCVQQSESPWFVGPNGFVLANPQPLETPIFCRGQLGFFQPPETSAQPQKDKPRWPLEDALIVAECLREALRPHCERVEIAGSIRRRKADVGDIELLYIPRYQSRQKDLLSEEAVNITDECIERVLACGQLAKRKNVKGSEMWGGKNKLAVHVLTGIPVDLFATTADAWHNYLVCRTGPAESNTAIATAAQARGWKWNPYGDGFTTTNGFIHCGDERNVFESVGLPYKEPWER